jgi:predicted nucleic acid-binding protein
MILETLLVDTGPLVALLDKKDEWHEWAVETFNTLRPPLLTCEAVITEAWHLLEGFPNARLSLSHFHVAGALRINFIFEKQMALVYNLLAKYSDVPMDFADACLVRMSELSENVRVWTLDRDFHFYHRHRTEQIPLLLPPR